MFELIPKFCIYCGRLESFVCVRCQGLFYEKSGFIAAKGLDNCLVGFVYNKALEYAIKQIKYAGYYRITQQLASILVNAHAAQISDLLSDSIAIPVPLAKEKLQLRGFNQAELLAREILTSVTLQQTNHALQSNHAASHPPILAPIIKRVSHTTTQVGKNKDWRRRNLSAAFQIDYGVQVPLPITEKPLRKALLVDDIYTSGITLEICADILRRNGFEQVNGLVLASAKRTIS
jgi:ComF family protein